MEDVSLFRLLKTFQRVLARFEEDSKKAKIHTVYSYNFTIQEQQEFVLSFIKNGGKVAFEAIFQSMETRIHAIVTFLGLLELLNAQQVSLIQGEGANNFWLMPYEEIEETESPEMPEKKRKNHPPNRNPNRPIRKS